MNIWIETKSEIKLTVRLSGEEAGDLRRAIQVASNNLALSLEQHRLCNSLAAALEEPECPGK